MNFLSSIITYFRRIVKAPSNTQLTDDLIIDYINRFWIMDVDPRYQYFDLKTRYRFQTAPGFDRYNMPLYNPQTEPGGVNNIGMYPVYQGFLSPVWINGVPVQLYTQENNFFNTWPNIIQQMNNVSTGDGTDNYSFTFPIAPNNTTPTNTSIQYILKGHVDISGIVSTGTNNDPIFGTTINTLIPTTSIEAGIYITTIDENGNSMVVSDSGQFLFDGANNLPNYGLLMNPGKAPYGNTALGAYSTTLNTVNYLTGRVNVTFPKVVPTGVNINAQCYLFQTGLPRGILFYNNVLTLRSPPDQQYLVELEGYLSPAAYFATSQTIEFAYMSEYIALGAARKMLSDVGDNEQLQFYEGRFLEQEALVRSRSQRQFTATRTQTIYSQGINQGQIGSTLGGAII